MDFLVFGFLCVPFAAYALVMLSRKSRWKALAETLGAEYVDGRWLGLGRIVGEHFEISLVKIGKGLFTRICMRAEADPGSFHLLRGFFGEHADWSFAWVPGQKTHRAFAWEITLPGYAQPTQEERDKLARFLPRSLSEVDRALGDARIRDVTIANGLVSAELSGVVSNSSRLTRALDALRTIASR